MNLVLPRKKHHTDPELWNEVFDNPTSYISPEELNREFVLPTADEMLRVLDKFKKPIFGWSGGKDSLVMHDILIRIGYKEMPGVFAHYGELEFPAMAAWLNVHTPPSVETMINDRWTVDWLLDNEENYLFPSTNNRVHYYTKYGTWWSHTEKYEKEGADLLLLGRRKADDNLIRGDQYGIRMGSGKLQYCPMRDWPHEAILAYMRYFQLPVPPTYDLPLGWQDGTCSWSGLGRPTKEEGWAYIEQCDPQLFYEMAPRFVSGQEYIELYG